MYMTITDQINAAIEAGARTAMTLPEILTEEIERFKASPEYAQMAEAENYYRNRSDVQRKEISYANRSNVKMEHPLLRKITTQKVSYAMAKPFSVETDEGGDQYAKCLEELFDHSFRQQIKGLVKNTIKSGIGYMAPYFGDDGKLHWMRLPSTEVIPLWLDAEHTRLGGYIRFYIQTVYEGKKPKEIQRVEYWDTEGVTYYRDNGKNTRLVPDYDWDPEGQSNKHSHFSMTHPGGKTEGYNWTEIPLVWLKYNDEELPLQYFIKDLIDDYNWQKSATADVLRDVAKFVWVLRGYNGQDLGEFMRQLRDALAINVANDGGVDKIEPTVDVASVLSFLDTNRRDLFDLAAAVDTKDPDLGNASGTAINFRYMDLDAECNDIAAELQTTFEHIKVFVDFYLQITGRGDYHEQTFSIKLNMDMPVNETDIINNAKASTGMISEQTILANHPWVKDVVTEQEQMAAEKQKAMEDYGAGLFDNLMSTGAETDGQGGDGDGEQT